MYDGLAAVLVAYLIFCFQSGPNWISVDRRHNDAAETRGLDSSFGQACSGVLFDTGRFMDIVGRRNEGKQK